MSLCYISFSSSVWFYSATLPTLTRKDKGRVTTLRTWSFSSKLSMLRPQAAQWSPIVTRVVGMKRNWLSKLLRLSKIVRKLRLRSKKRLTRDKGEGCWLTALVRLSSNGRKIFTVNEIRTWKVIFPQNGRNYKKLLSSFFKISDF